MEVRQYAANSGNIDCQDALMGQLVFAGVTVGSLGGGVQIPDGQNTKYTHTATRDGD